MFKGRFLVYIVRCADGSLYVGFTTNLDERLKAHNDGHGAKWTAGRRPVYLVFSEAYEDQPSAVRRERQLKGWTAEKKEALIAGDLNRLKMLAKRKS